MNLAAYNGTIEEQASTIDARRFANEIHLSHQLCNAPQPDDPARRCIRYADHQGPHQTFVSEWNEGDKDSRRRPRPASAAPKHEPKGKPNRRPFRRPSTARHFANVSRSPVVNRTSS